MAFVKKKRKKKKKKKGFVDFRNVKNKYVSFKVRSFFFEDMDTDVRSIPHSVSMHLSQEPHSQHYVDYA